MEQDDVFAAGLVDALEVVLNSSRLGVATALGDDIFLGKAQEGVLLQVLSARHVHEYLHPVAALDQVPRVDHQYGQVLCLQLVILPVVCLKSRELLHEILAEPLVYYVQPTHICNFLYCLDDCVFELLEGTDEDDLFKVEQGLDVVGLGCFEVDGHG